MKITGDNFLSDEHYVDRCENQRRRRCHDVHFDLQIDELMLHTTVSIQYISPLKMCYARSMISDRITDK